MVDEVWMDKNVHYCKIRLRSGRIVLPLEGKGDRSAVDEVNISPAPLRGASIAYCLLPIANLFLTFL